MQALVNLLVPQLGASVLVIKVVSDTMHMGHHSSHSFRDVPGNQRGNCVGKLRSQALRQCHHIVLRRENTGGEQVEILGVHNVALTMRLVKLFDQVEKVGSCVILPSLELLVDFGPDQLLGLCQIRHL